MSTLQLRSLKGTTSFDRVFRQCRKFTGGPLVAHLRFRRAVEPEEPTQRILRVGIMVKKKVYARAVDRNRIKRLIREAMRAEVAEQYEFFATVDALIISWHTQGATEPSSLSLNDVRLHLRELVGKAAEWTGRQGRSIS